MGHANNCFGNSFCSFLKKAAPKTSINFDYSLFAPVTKAAPAGRRPWQNGCHKPISL
jgi:hypothetical protein